MARLILQWGCRDTTAESIWSPHFVPWDPITSVAVTIPWAATRGVRGLGRHKERRVLSPHAEGESWATSLPAVWGLPLPPAGDMCGRCSSPPDGGNNTRRCLHFTPPAPLLHPCVNNKELGLRGRAVTKAATASTSCRQDLQKCLAIRPLSFYWKVHKSSKAKCSPPLAFPLLQIPLQNNQAWKKERRGCDTQLKRHLWVLW